MGWARATAKQSPHHPDHPQRRNPLNGQPINPSPPQPHPGPGGVTHPARQQRTAQAQLASRDLEQAFDRLNPDYGVPADTQNPYGKRTVQDREAALALGTRVAVAASHERPNPVMWLAGQDYRAADATRTAHLQHVRQRHGPERLGPRQLTPPGTASSKEHSRWLQTTRPPSPATSSRP